MADDSMKALLEGMNEDLAHEYAAVIQYRTYASAVSGPHRQELRAFFTGEIADEEATLTRYVQRRKQAEEAGEYGLANDLDDIIADESKHRDELRLMLKRWPESGPRG